MPLVRSAASQKLEHPSIIYGADFDINKTYYIETGQLYPHVRWPTALAGSATDVSSACSRYTWHRRRGRLQNKTGAGDGSGAARQRRPSSS